MQLFKDRIGGGSPLERLAVCVVGRDEVINALYELFDTGERAAPNGLVSDQGKEAFDLIEPGAVGWDEMHVPARPSGQPGLDPGMTVRGVVVADAVNIQISGDGLVDLAQEGQKLLMPVSLMTFADDLAL